MRCAGDEKRHYWTYLKFVGSFVPPIPPSSSDFDETEKECLYCIYFHFHVFFSEEQNRRQQSPPVSLNHRCRTVSTGIGKMRYQWSRIRYRWFKRGVLEQPVPNFRPPLSYLPTPVDKVRYRWFSDTSGNCSRRKNI